MERDRAAVGRRQEAEETSATQVLAMTYSAQLVSRFEFADILAIRRETGGAQLARLRSHDQIYELEMLPLAASLQLGEGLPRKSTRSAARP